MRVIHSFYENVIILRLYLTIIVDDYVEMKENHERQKEHSKQR